MTLPLYWYEEEEEEEEVARFENVYRNVRVFEPLIL
jgi:hypothetical protein